MPRWTFQIGVILIAAHIVVSHLEPVKDSFYRGPPLEHCERYFGYTRRIEWFPFCLPRPAARVQDMAERAP